MNHGYRKWVRVAALGAALLLADGLRCEEWAVLGSRAMGMGGAGVAVTRGALSSYWNPAGLAAPDGEGKWFDLWLPITANVGAIGDALKEIDDIANIVGDLDFDDLETKLDDPAQFLNDTELQDALKLLTTEIDDLGGDGTGIVTNVSAGLMAKFGGFSVSALGLIYAGGVTVVDFNNLAFGDEGITGVVGAGNDRTGQLSPEGQAFADSLAADGLATQDQAEELVYQAEQGGVPIDDPTAQQNLRDILTATQNNIGGNPEDFFTNNESGVNLKGILVQEYGLSYAHSFFDLFSVGVTAKAMYGTTYSEPFTLAEIENARDLIDELFDTENDQESLRFGIDAGVIVQPLPWFSLGVSGRNLNRPRFALDGRGDYTLEPQIRAGVGLHPLPGLTIAADIDVLENESEALEGYRSRVVGGGIEWWLFDVVALRGGMSKNLADDSEDPVVHLGVGLGLGVATVEVAGAFSLDLTSVEGTDIPERAGLAFLLTLGIPL